MGTFYETIWVGNPAGGGLVNVSAPVDTGASYTMLPASLLQRLGIEARRGMGFALADGRRVEYDIGEAFIVNLNGVADAGRPEANYGKGSCANQSWQIRAGHQRRQGLR